MPQNDVAGTSNSAAFVPDMDSDKRALLIGGATATSVGTVLALLIVSVLRGGLGDGFYTVVILCAFALLPVWTSVWALRHGPTPLQAGIFNAAGLLLGLSAHLIALAAC